MGGITIGGTGKLEYSKQRTVRSSSLAVAALAALLIGLGVSGTALASVPLDSLGAVGDEEIVMPPFASNTYLPPFATPASVGDINGDGIDDVGIVLPVWNDPADSSGWITFSPSTLPATLNAGQGSWQGMKLTGSFVNGTLTGVGDVNGDGLDDFVVAQPARLAVIFGSASSETVDVDHLAQQGFYIDEAGGGGNGGSGSSDAGVGSLSHGVAAVGDQNSDGIPDIAFRHGSSIEVAYIPPNPAGIHIDATNLGDQGYAITTPWTSDTWTGPFVSSLGDLNGDSRPDLAIFWDDPATGETHATGVLAPSGGTTLDVTQVTADNAGFDLVAPNARLADGISVGDQNGDGRTDVALTTANRTSWRRTLTIAYSPAIGTTRSITPTSSDAGLDSYTGTDFAIDVGDLDGDGRDDVANEDCVLLSSMPTYHDTHVCGITVQNHGVLVLGSTPDRNGDGTPELLTVYAHPFVFENHDYSATWHEQVYLSAPAPSPTSVDLPSQSSGSVRFGARFLTNPSGAMRTLAGRGLVTVRGIGTPQKIVSGNQIVNANSKYTRATVDVSALSAKLVRGQPYEYRVGFQTSRGLSGTTAPRWFVYGGASQLHQINGTANRDRLTGTGLPDIVQAQGGDDVVNVRDGGRDYVACGAGSDRVVADATDRVYNCEDVVRR